MKQNKMVASMMRVPMLVTNMIRNNKAILCDERENYVLIRY